MTAGAPDSSSTPEEELELEALDLAEWCGYDSDEAHWARAQLDQQDGA